ncbi:YdiU family protein [Allopusillimonas soli]|uniref:Protein nucleotidyltransferase YdiU n=1 Tax=Allopusillimonas soli TaxID=659016 RepID=A0A853F8E1_9BURK|nr:YdiU family protein [Allopusillimonas soli]NYT36904.1 YdiU family protein [Allopusillimonas soli]TEA75362.1 YdiU family protein [Allopusillimonas soli]
MKTALDQLNVVNSYAELPRQFHTMLLPQPLTDPRLLHANPAVAALLGLSDAVLNTPAFLQVFSGQRPLPGGKTLAAVYSGHQFGVWAGQLGDGRAHLLGEVVAPSGHWELQLKGSGMTPYSRMGDGRAVLRSSVREYLASEAMAGLGIPTTRALALVVSDDKVYRETVETAAIVTRVSPSFVRFGSFEHWSAAPETMRLLLDYVVDRHYPQCREPEAGMPDDAQGVVFRFLRAVVARTARLMADWQTAGFCHGVMNTDNMSIIGLTLDYGPYGFMDSFQANHVCNHSDTQGRYAWNAQPAVAHWNLYRLGAALLQMGVDPEGLKAQLRCYEADFLAPYQANLARKLGLAAYREQDESLVDEWWKLLHTQRADFSLSFRRLADVTQDSSLFLSLFDDHEPARAWLDTYLARIAQDGRSDAARRAQMNGANPLYVLRNHLAETAIRAAAKGDASEIETLMTLLGDPYTERPGYEAYAQPAPEWASQLEVSCSS